MGNSLRTFVHPRRVARELAAAEERLIALSEESAAHARNAQSLRDELHEVRTQLEATRSQLADCEKSADAVTEELMRTRARLDQKELELKGKTLELKEKEEIESQFAIFEERLTRAERMKETYQTRIDALRKEIAELRGARRTADEDADWFTLPPEL